MRQAATCTSFCLCVLLHRFLWALWSALRGAPRPVQACTGKGPAGPTALAMAGIAGAVATSPVDMGAASIGIGDATVSGGVLAADAGVAVPAAGAVRKTQLGHLSTLARSEQPAVDVNAPSAGDKDGDIATGHGQVLDPRVWSVPAFLRGFIAVCLRVFAAATAANTVILDKTILRALLRVLRHNKDHFLQELRFESLWAMKAAALCKSRLEAACSMFSRHTRLATGNTTACFKDVKQECVSAAFQLKLAVSYRAQLTSSVAQFFAGAPVVLAAPALVSTVAPDSAPQHLTDTVAQFFAMCPDCPEFLAAPVSASTLSPDSAAPSSLPHAPVAPLARSIALDDSQQPSVIGDVYRHDTMRSLPLTSAGVIALVGKDEATGIASGGLLVGPDGEPLSRKPQLSDRELHALAAKSVLAAVQPGTFFSVPEPLQAAVAKSMALGRPGMSQYLVDTGAGSIFLTSATAAKAGVGQGESAVRVADIHGGINNAVGGEAICADLIDIHGVLHTNVLLAREAFTSPTFAIDLIGFSPLREIGWTAQFGTGQGSDHAVEALRSPDGIVVPVHFEGGNPYVYLDIKPSVPVTFPPPVLSAAPVAPQLIGGAASLRTASSIDRPVSLGAIDIDAGCVNFVCNFCSHDNIVPAEFLHCDFCGYHRPSRAAATVFVPASPVVESAPLPPTLPVVDSIGAAARLLGRDARPARKALQHANKAAARANAVAAAAEAVALRASTKAFDDSARAAAESASRLAQVAKTAADAANQDRLRNDRAAAKRADNLVRIAEIRALRATAKAAAKELKQQRVLAKRGAAAVLDTVPVAEMGTLVQDPLVDVPPAATEPMERESVFDSPRMVSLLPCSLETSAPVSWLTAAVSTVVTKVRQAFSAVSTPTPLPRSPAAPDLLAPAVR